MVYVPMFYVGVGIEELQPCQAGLSWTELPYSIESKKSANALTICTTYNTVLVTCQTHIGGVHK